MSRSKRWKTEWALFLDENGRRQYNRICRRCVHGCKQSFRADLIQCPKYINREAKNTPKKVLKKAIKSFVSGSKEVGNIFYPMNVSD